MTHDRALAGHVARVESLVEHRRPRGIAEGKLLVAERIEDFDDSLVHRDRVRNQHEAAQHGGQPARREGLAGAGMAVEEDRAARVERRAQPVEQLVRDDHAVEGVVDRLARDFLLVDRLLAHERDVVGERHRRGPDVAAATQGVRGLVPALVGQAVAQLSVEAEARAHFDAAFGAHELEDLVDDRAGERQRGRSPGWWSARRPARGACRAGPRGRSATGPSAPASSAAERAGPAAAISGETGGPLAASWLREFLGNRTHGVEDLQHAAQPHRGDDADRDRGRIRKAFLAELRQDRAALRRCAGAPARHVRISSARHSRTTSASTAPDASDSSAAMNASDGPKNAPAAAISLTSPAPMPLERYNGRKHSKPNARTRERNQESRRRRASRLQRDAAGEARERQHVGDAPLGQVLAHGQRDQDEQRQRRATLSAKYCSSDSRERPLPRSGVTAAAPPPPRRSRQQDQLMTMPQTRLVDRVDDAERLRHPAGRTRR